MPALDRTLRGNFEKEVIKARDEAENAARAALATLAVERDRPFDSMVEEKRALRRALRARARQLGEGDMNAGMPRVIEEIAYEQWHRMLFARFLAENDLLMHPEGVAVTLEECAELAQEEGAEDLWAVATRYASLMLPGIFRVDDPALQVRFAPEGRHKLVQIVTDLPKAVFTSDDGLGWAYQFWQSRKKDEVNASGRKIGGADIAPVTQLFTEDYMVKFLLHNTLGAWWAHRHPESPLNQTFEYLRYRDDGTPAAGTFDGWPDRVAEVTMMDPCGGSGHFIVTAFEMFYRMRMEEEGLSAAEAGDAVIRENTHMLEIDLRCTQIAAFNLALAAWKSGGYRELPLPNIACSGVPVQGQLEEWTKFAGGDEALKWTLERLYNQFRHAPDLGSLISPTDIPVEERMFVGDYEQMRPLLETVLSQATLDVDPLLSLTGKTAADMLKASRLLAARYTFIATNVPYLIRSKQSSFLLDFCQKRYPISKADLATVFVERCKDYCSIGGTYAIVTPQNWLFLKSYGDLREQLLTQQTWEHVTFLGSGATATASWDVLRGLPIIINSMANDGHKVTGIEISDPDEESRAIRLRNGPLLYVKQSQLLQNPDLKISLQGFAGGKLLSQYADSLQGIATGDYRRFGRYFWEQPLPSSEWSYQQSTFEETTYYAGRENVIFWQGGNGELSKSPQARIQGIAAWNRKGVAVKQMRKLPCTIYTGEMFDNNVAVIVPKSHEHLGALWAFCSSPEFNQAVRKVDKKISVTNATLVQVPFDLAKWSKIADGAGPLPEPRSDDPAQWLFLGNPHTATESLQVAVARLLGYSWPDQKHDTLSTLSDSDGIVCIPSVIGEQAAGERIRTLLLRSYLDGWSHSKQRQLLTDVSFKGRSLDKWLRDGFFKQHCNLFNNRPFIWHIWDGRKDGFSALVNYHKLDHAKLERLIYTYLGDWINTQRAEQEQGVAGAEGRLVAALELKKKLELILEGEPPYDIYVRWKPLHEQPIGWNPDLNDGVRMNIRPFVTAGVLRHKFTIHWKKDRGKNPDGSERHNDLHYTRAEKEAANKIYAAAQGA